MLDDHRLDYVLPVLGAERKQKVENVTLGLPTFGRREKVT